MKVLLIARVCCDSALLAQTNVAQFIAVCSRQYCLRRWVSFHRFCANRVQKGILREAQASTHRLTSTIHKL